MSYASREQARVIIIGASLAGSMAALSLAQAGVPVTLIDKETFPRRKACGEGLSARGQAELAAAGCSLEALGCDHTKLAGYRIFKEERSLEIPDRAGLVGVSRSDLDRRLLERAECAPSVRVLLGEKATVRELAPGRCSVRVGQVEEKGGFLIIADGANSPTLRSLGRSPKGSHSPRLGTSSGWRLTQGVLDRRVHTFLVPGGEIYLTPLPDNRLNLSVLGSRSLIQSFAHERSIVKNIETICELLEISLSPERPPLSCGGIHTLYRGAQCQGAFVVGDACETFDPCAGFGMTHALFSGRLVSEYILEALGCTDPHVSLGRYERIRETKVRDVRGFTRITTTTMGSRLGRMSLPFLVSSGLAGTVSDSVHSPAGSSFARRMVSLVGAPAM